jgi:3-hydroxybutyryl-CoA dehydratase
MSSGVAPVVREITQEQLHAYADASGDHNPIHVDAEFARTTPFGGTIAHGMLVLALIGEMMHAAFGDEWLRGGSMKVRFKAPTRPGSTVTASAEPSGEREEDGTRVVTYAVQCADQAGEVLIDGRASVRLPA